MVDTDTQDKKVPVTIYAESTPNPAAMKFVANKKLVLAPYEFKNIEEAQPSPLATGLFHFPFVKEVFIDENYVSVIKYDIAEWNEISMEVREFLRAFVEQGKDIVSDEAISKQPGGSNETNTKANPAKPDLSHLSETSQQIVAILDEYVKPAVASDGGNIMFDSYDEEAKIVKVILQGACSGCPSSTFTLKNGIETMLKNMLEDKVNEVIAING